MIPDAPDPLAKVSQEIAVSALRVWMAHERRGTVACVDALTDALPVLALVACGPRRQTLSGRLCRELGNPFALRRRGAARALGAMGLAAAQNPATIPALESALHDRNRRVREAAIHTLGQMGSAISAVPSAQRSLLAALESGDVRVTWLAARALCRIAAALPDSGLDAELAAIASRSPRVRHALTAKDTPFNAPAGKGKPASDSGFSAISLSASRAVGLVGTLRQGSPSERARAASKIGLLHRAGVRIWARGKRIETTDATARPR